jgi:hypothetical protein
MENLESKIEHLEEVLNWRDLYIGYVEKCIAEGKTLIDYGSWYREMVKK